MPEKKRKKVIKRRITPKNKVCKTKKRSLLNKGDILYWISHVDDYGKDDFAQVRVERVKHANDGTINSVKVSVWNDEAEEWETEEEENADGDIKEVLVTTVLQRDELRFLFKTEEEALIRRDEIITQDVIDLFEDLEDLTREACAGNIGSLILHGPGGTGKSYVVEKIFEEFGIGFENFYSGSSTKADFFNLLHGYKDKGSVVVFDDLEDITGEKLGFLKAATDTKKVRTLYYGTTQSNAVPINKFDFEGTAIILSNKRLNEGHLKKSWQPMLSRGHQLYLDLSPEQMLAKIKLIAEDPDETSEYSKEIRLAVRDFLIEHKEKLGKNLDLRAFKKVADLRENAKKEKWRRLALRSVVKNKAGYDADI